MRHADSELEADRFAEACRAYLTAAEHYWLALSASTRAIAERRRLHDAQVSAFRAAIPLLPHPTTPFALAIDGESVAGYLFLPTERRSGLPTVTWRVEPPVTVEAGYWHVAVPILQSGTGCAVFATGSARPDVVFSAVTQWVQQQPGVDLSAEPLRMPRGIGDAQFYPLHSIERTAMPQLTGINHISVTVTDIERSLPWYSDLLGLTKLMEAAQPDGSGSFVLLGKPDWSMCVGLHTHPANEGEPFAESRTGLDHVSFLVPDRAELVAWEARLSERGIEHSPVNEQPGYSVLVFRDPDNIQLELMSAG